MRRDEVLDRLRQHAPEIATFGVQALAVFGSVARDEAGAASDVDILVQFVPPRTFDRYMGLKLFLEDLLDRPVDLVTVQAMRPAVQETAEREAIYVA